MSAATQFAALNLCVLTVSDSRTLENDSSGDFLCGALKEHGHYLFDRALLPDNKYLLRAKLSNWIAEEAIDGVLVNGGTGFLLAATPRQKL